MNYSITMAPALIAAALTTTSAIADTLLVPEEYATIQAAIAAAVEGDDIVLADGAHTGVGNKNLVFLGKTLTLRSESGDRDACVVDCEGDGRLARFFSGDTATVRSITVVNGNPVGESGGAVHIFSGGSPSFTDCAFVDCTALNGGSAIRVEQGGDVTIDGCSFRGNFAQSGGGAVDAYGGRISGSVFLDNIAVFTGGGARFQSDFEEISDSLFQGNENTGFGGGGGVGLGFQTSAILRNVVFLDNRAQYAGGAAIYGTAPTPTFVNCLFTGNVAATSADGDPATGGAVDASAGTPDFINCTFSGNMSEGYGGAVSVNLGAIAQLIGCVLWENDAPDGPEIRVSYPGIFKGGSVSVSYSDVAGGEAGVSVGALGTLEWGDGNIDEDPLFDEHYCLAAGSPCIDVADDEAVPADETCDIDGRRRFVDGDGNDTTTVDMGAHEFQTCAPDVDRDDAVGFGDLLAILSAWGPYEPCPPAIPQDLDHDCEVGFSDLLAVLASWGPCP